MITWIYQQENKLWELHISGEYCGLFDAWDKSKVIKIISLLQK